MSGGGGAASAGPGGAPGPGTPCATAGALQVNPNPPLPPFVGGTNPGEFDIVHHMAVDSKGNLYTAEIVNNRRAQKFVPAEAW